MTKNTKEVENLFENLKKIIELYNTLKYFISSSFSLEWDLP